MRNFFYGPFLIGRMGIIRYLCLSKQKEMWVMKKTVQAWMQRMRRMPYKRRRLWLWSILLVCTGIGVTATLLRFPSMSHDFEVTDQLGGNIFPSAILSVAATEANIIEPPKGNTLGNPKSLIAVRLTAPRHHALVRIELAETPFYARSVSEFVLERRGEEYLIFPDVLWRYEALRNNAQAEPISVVATVEVNGQPWGQKVRTFSVRSINECLIGYREVLENGTRFHSTKQFYAAYVNEESPMIDPILREALNTRIVRRFLGYQGDSAMVDRQVYALWNVLQRRGFKYSSVSYSSLSSNVVYSQRVRTLEHRYAAVRFPAEGNQHQSHPGASPRTHVRGVLHGQQAEASDVSGDDHDRGHRAERLFHGGGNGFDDEGEDARGDVAPDV